MAQAKQVVLVTTVKTSGKVVKNRFVDAQGAAVKAAGNAKIAGTARSAATAAGEVIQVFLKG